MSAVQVRITTAEYQASTFGWYEIYANRGALALGAVVADAEFNAAFFGTIFIHANLIAGDTWTYWVRAVDENDNPGALRLLGSILVTSSASTDSDGGAGGTVTSVSVVTAAGISGAVADPTTTPAITLAVATQAPGDNTTNAATTAFVTAAIAAAIAGVNPAVTVQAATTSAANTAGLTYSNGVGGIGATLTGPVNTALTVDGYTFTALGQRLLVKNDTQAPAGAFNGCYYVTQIQTALLPLILTRALDYDMPSDINNTGAVPVVNGTVNAHTSWLLISSVTTVGTDPLTYTQFTFSPTGTANFIIDGGGATITPGIKGNVGPWDYDITLSAVTLLADQSGSIVLDFWVDTYGNYPPTVADTITAAAKPTITAALKSQDTTLTGWTVLIPAGRTLRVNVDSVTSIQSVGVALKYTR